MTTSNQSTALNNASIIALTETYNSLSHREKHDFIVHICRVMGIKSPSFSTVFDVIEAFGIDAYAEYMEDQLRWNEYDKEHVNRQDFSDAESYNEYIESVYASGREPVDQDEAGSAEEARIDAYYAQQVSGLTQAQVISALDIDIEDDFICDIDDAITYFGADAIQKESELYKNS